MANLQPIELLVRNDGLLLDVHSIFHTIQGEGPFAGRPAVFVRLAGCTLQCDGCDTDYTSGRGGMTLGDAFAKTWEALGPRPTNLVVLTGGEPFRQSIGPFVRLLLGNGVEVQLETNGTVFLEDFPWGMPGVTVVCSPKTHVNLRLMPVIDHLKYVLDHRHVGPDGLPTRTLGERYVPALPWPEFPRERVWVSPMDAGTEVENSLNVQACVKSCLTHGYRLSLQVHKLLGVP